MDIVCLGELLVDMFPEEMGRRLADVSAFHPKPGGAPANAAVAAARLGARSAFIGKVGDDAFGHHLVKVIADQGVDVSGMRYDTEARTTLAFIAKPDENSSEYVFYRNPGADTRLRPDELAQDLTGGTAAFHFGSLSLSDEPIRSATHEAVRQATRAGALISFDVNFRPSLWRSWDDAHEQIRAIVSKVNLIKVNEAELALLSGGTGLEDEAHALLDLGPELVVVTLGSDGSYFATANASGRVPPFRVTAVDSTGAGDSFVAGMLCGMVLPMPGVPAKWRERLSASQLAASLRYANAVGAITSTQQGVIPSLPSAAQVEEFLARSENR
jgi:fructokinase